MNSIIQSDIEGKHVWVLEGRVQNTILKSGQEGLTPHTFQEERLCCSRGKGVLDYRGALGRMTAKSLGVLLSSLGRKVFLKKCFAFTKFPLIQNKKYTREMKTESKFARIMLFDCMV